MAFDFQQLQLPKPPTLPAPPPEYDPKYIDELNRTLALYFTRLDTVLRAFVANVPPVP
jgi:hypothetical protein